MLKKSSKVQVPMTGVQPGAELKLGPCVLELLLNFEL
jgi:hypothetical protein